MEGKSTTKKTTRAPRKKKEEIKITETTVTKPLEFSLVEVIIIILITTALVSVASGIIVFRNYDKLTPLNNVLDNRSSNEIIENYNQILEHYVGEVDKNELIDAAIKGMYDILEDEYSTYIGKDATETFQEQLGGQYSGIGVEITLNQDAQIIIHRVFKDSPAEKAGLMKDDILLKLDGVDLKDKDPSYVSDNIKGSNKQKFNIVYSRKGKTNEVTIERDLVTIDSISSREYDSVGYLKIETFSGTVLEQVQKELDSFGKDIKSLVIDLRDNTGGFLNSASDLSDLFLDKDQVIYKIKDKGGKISSYKSKTGVYRKFDKIVVLINGNSASASEILTLALKENLDAKVVGTKSFGKGTVQETRQLSSGAMVKYTVSYWLSPKGNSINKIGIKPDYEVKEEDKQLDMALTVAH